MIGHRWRVGDSPLPSFAPESGMGTKRVCHVVFEHRTFDGRIFHKEAVSLARAGYEVVLLVPGLPGGRLGKRKDHQIGREGAFVRDGVRFETYPYRRWVPREFNLRFRVCRQDILRRLTQLQPDLCHFHEDGVTMEAAAELKAVLPHCKLIFDFHEFFLHRLRISEKKMGRLRQYVETENRVLAAADGIVTVSDFMSQYYRTLTDAPVATVMNSQSARVFKASDAPLERDDTFWVVHEGRLLFDRGLQLVLDAARLLRHPKVRFLLIGDFPPGEQAIFTEQTARDGTTDRFHLTGLLPYGQVPDWLRRGQLGLCLNETPNALMGTPNKFFNYLRFGVPVLTLEHPIMGPIVRKSDCGNVLPRPGVAADLAAAIDGAAASPARQAERSAAATRLFTEELNWERMEQRLFDLYRTVLGGRAD
jgi:glycosyltransferase involved in cell wall biosynthesis